MTRVSFTTKSGKRVSFNTKSKRKSGGSKKSRKSGKKSRRKSSKSKGSSRSKRSSGSKKMAKKGGRKKGTSGMTRTRKFLLGLGVGTAVSTVAAITRVREIEGAAPIIDAMVGGGVEAQIGTAIPRLIRQVLPRIGVGSNGGNGLALEGA